jgi:RNA polymerase sigma-70 factor (ECF subfamily)
MDAPSVGVNSGNAFFSSARPSSLWRRSSYDDPSFADEVVQAVRERVLLAAGGTPPRIVAYRGRGALLGWLSTTAARTLVDLQRSPQHRPTAGDGDPPEPASSDPEVGYLKTRYRNEFRAAFDATIAGLPPDEANLLRLYHLEGMTADAIAALLRVSSKTVRRRLERTRQRILDEVHRRLREQLRISPSELDSLLRFIDTELSVTLSRLG